MKKIIAAFFVGIFSLGLIHAQTNETLTNSSIVKMVKAGLSDELIIDMIQSSPADFNLSDDAVKSLTAESVSAQVIAAMKSSASGTKAAKEQVKQPVKESEKLSEKPSTVKSPEGKSQTETATKKPGNINNKVSKASVIDALGYTEHIKELVKFHEQEFEAMSVTIEEWDKEINLCLLEAQKINERIARTENELKEKKNADSKKYSSDILLLKKNLVEYRVEYKKIKDKMVQYGQTITKNLAELSKEKVRSLEKEYSSASQLIKSVDADPTKADKRTEIIFADRKINDGISYYISPSSEILYWHQNEIDVLQGIVKEWNLKVQDVIGKDAELSTQLEPLNAKLQEYKANSKKYKTEISGLKKQIGALEKERKLVSEKMEKEINELADYLKQTSMESQNSLKERFTDIIENITYTYQEKLNL